MAECPRCHAPLQPGAFACGTCGLAAGAPAGAAGATGAARSRRLRWAFVGGALAVTAAVLVWYFAVRGPATTGAEFVGTWRSQAVQSIGSAAVSHWGDAFRVLLTSGQTGQQARVTAHLDGEHLVITPDDFGALCDPGADKLKLLLALAAGDFRITLSSVDPDHLRLSLRGTSPAGQDVDERATLERVTTAPAAAP